MSHSLKLTTLTTLISSCLLVACSNKMPVQNTRTTPTIKKNTPVYKPSNSIKKNTNNNPNNNINVSDVINVDGAKTYVPLLDAESIEELADLLEATDMSMVEDDELAIQQFGDLWIRIRKGYKLPNSRPSSNNRYIEAQKGWFISHPGSIQPVVARASRYLFYTIQEAEKRKLPTELALLPIVESSYDPNATSGARAAGMWQFIPSTGLEYGLDQTYDYDGRRDIIESTRAAYDYLEHLYQQFNSWELALAAYNTGPNNVRKAINKAGSSNFWNILPYIPKETRDYVPRLLAVSQIIYNPETYGVYLPAIANRQHFRIVPVGDGASLYDVSRITKIPYDELSYLNTSLLQGQVSSNTPKRIIIPDSLPYNIDEQINKLSPIAMIQGQNTYTAANTKTKAPIYTYTSKSNTTNNTDFNLTTNNTNNTFSNDGFKITSNTPRNRSNNNTPISNSNNSISNSNLITKTITNNSPLNNNIILNNDTIKNMTANNTLNNTAVNNNIQTQPTQPINTTNNTINKTPNPTTPYIATQNNPLPTNPLPTTLPPKTVANQNINILPAVQPKPSRDKRSIYIVQPGDTLINIANRSGLDWQDIAQWNHLNPYGTLYAGSALILYNAKPIEKLNIPTTTPTKAHQDRYLVQSGDTLIGIANRFNLPVKDLAGYNNLEVNAKVRTGQNLWLVNGKSKPTTTTNKTNSANSQKFQSYRVQSGDSLIGLANRYKISLDELAKINNLSKNDNLYLGSVIKIPININLNTNNNNSNHNTTSSNKSNTKVNNKATSYTVRSGDTLIGIANQFGTSAEEIATLNRFSANTRLNSGQVIKLPNGKTTKSNNKTDKSSSHKVQKGDTLSSIANRYGISKQALAEANKLSTKSAVLLGSTLIIPKQDSNTNSANKNTPKEDKKTTESNKSTQGKTIKSTQSYQVKSGDSLIGLAARYKVSVEDLAKTNGLSTKAKLQRGQSIKVPKLTSRYQVKSGDTLIGLAKKYGISAKELAEMNGLSTQTNLKRGQTLTVPNR